MRTQSQYLLKMETPMFDFFSLGQPRIEPHQENDNQDVADGEGAED
jgi:hypothetical protein